MVSGREGELTIRMKKKYERRIENGKFEIYLKRPNPEQTLKYSYIMLCVRDSEH